MSGEKDGGKGSRTRPTDMVKYRSNPFWEATTNNTIEVDMETPNNPHRNVDMIVDRKEWQDDLWETRQHALDNKVRYIELLTEQVHGWAEFLSDRHCIGEWEYIEVRDELNDITKALEDGLKAVNKEWMVEIAIENMEEETDG